MYITNPEIIENVYVCGKYIAKYLEANKIPILSIKNGKFYFNNVEKVQELVKILPKTTKILDAIWLKFVNKK